MILAFKKQTKLDFMSMRHLQVVAQKIYLNVSNISVYNLNIFSLQIKKFSGRAQGSVQSQRSL